MSTEDGDNPPNPRVLDTSAEHANRNRTQLELLKAAVERKKHAAYIDAMLERTAPGESAASPQRTDAPGEEKKDSGPSRD